MKIFVSSFSGNVGKSTLAHQMLVPLLGAELVKIETINDSGSCEGEVMTSGDLDQLIRKMLLVDGNLVVDCGSSNIESFLKKSEEFGGVLEDFDYFVVPVTTDKKQINDTVSTVSAFQAAGIDLSRIRVVINRVGEAKDELATREALEDRIGLESDQIVGVGESEVFKRLGKETSVFEICTDPTDFGALAKQATDSDEMEALIAKHIAKRTAKATADRLKKCFAALNLAEV